MTSRNRDTTPGRWRFWQLRRAGKAAGLTDEAARVYATLMWWGEHYGLDSPPIHSGRRSARKQQELIDRYEAGDPGVIVRPGSPTGSRHVRGEAFDLERRPHLYVYGDWIERYLDGRWGGNFSSFDDVHFDLG